MTRALLLVAHGARDPRAQADAAALAAAVETAHPGGPVGLAFIELARPDVPEGLRKLVEAGAERMVVVPLLFLAASHVKRDLPAHLARAQTDYPGRSFRLAPPLGLHARLVALLRRRLAAALAASPRPVPAEETAVLLAGRGTSDPDANGDLAKLARLLAEGTTFLAVEPAFIGVTQPDLPRGLDHLVRLGARRIVLVPLLLFPGAMTERVAAAADDARRRAPGVDVTTAAILGPDPALVPLVLDRAAEAEGGAPPGSAASRGGPYIPVREHRERRGLLLVYTGDGKGKTTAALGLALRAAGHGHRVRVFQFIKGARPTGEWTTLATLPTPVPIEPLGDRFTWETPGDEASRQLAEAGWRVVEPHLADPALDLLVLDELNVVLDKGLLDTDAVVSAIAARPPTQHVVVTGRGAPAALVEAADLVSEIRPVKHPFRSGVRAQPGIEF